MRRLDLLLFQLSKGIPKGKRIGEIQTEMVGCLKNGNVQFLLCADFVFLLPCASCNALHSVKFSTALISVFAKELDHRRNDAAVYICVSAHFLAVSCSSVSELFKICQPKDLFFSFHNGPFFSWAVAHCQANVSLILQKGYSKVLYLIQYSCSLYRFRPTVMRVSLSTLLN